MNRLLSAWGPLGLCTVMFAAVLASGCGTFPEAEQPSKAHSTNETVIVDEGTSTQFHRGDKITIELLDTGSPIAPLQQIIREDGTITLPLNQTIVAAEKTKGELENEIREIYVPKYYRRMTVNIRPEERSYFVTGEVKNPGQKVHTGRITALKAIGAAGDFTDFANRSRVEITRANGAKVKMNARKALQNPALDVPVYPNDTVHVSRRLF